MLRLLRHSPCTSQYRSVDPGCRSLWETKIYEEITRWYTIRYILYIYLLLLTLISTSKAYAETYLRVYLRLSRGTQKNARVRLACWACVLPSCEHQQIEPFICSLTDHDVMWGGASVSVDVDVWSTPPCINRTKGMLRVATCLHLWYFLCSPSRTFALHFALKVKHY